MLKSAKSPQRVVAKRRETLAKLKSGIESGIDERMVADRVWLQYKGDILLCLTTGK
jgi:hypothetical protein